MIRVHLSLQYPALEAGVRAMLASDPEINVADDGPLTREHTTAEAVDVRIMTPAALARLSTASAAADGATGIVVLGADNGLKLSMWAETVPWALLPMEVSAEELCAAVRAVAAGLIVGARELLVRPEEMNLAPSPLTGREVEILGMLSRGLANKQIAVQLGISEHTVKFHVSSIYTKLNVSNRTEAVREGLRNGWIAL